MASLQRHVIGEARNAAATIISERNALTLTELTSEACQRYNSQFALLYQRALDVPGLPHAAIRDQIAWKKAFLLGIQVFDLMALFNNYAVQLSRDPDELPLDRMYRELASVVRILAARNASQPATIANTNANGKDNDSARRSLSKPRKKTRNKRTNNAKSSDSDTCRHCRKLGHRQAHCGGLSRSGKRGPAYDPSKGSRQRHSPAAPASGLTRANPLRNASSLS